MASERKSWLRSFLNTLTKGKFAAVGRYVLAIIPLAWIFHLIDFHRLRGALESTALWTIPAMIFMAVMLMFLQGIRWWVLLRAFLPKLSVAEVLSCHFKGIYYSIFLPTSAAQDVVRSVLLSRTADYGVAWGATWLTRITGLAVMMLLSICGIAFVERGVAPPGMAAAMFASGGLIVILGVLSFSKRSTRIFRGLSKKLLPVKATETIEHIREGVYRYRDKHAGLALTLVLTTVTQILFVVNASLMVKGITGTAHLVECFIYIPLIEIICLSVPLTPNGIGIRDALSAFMFHRMGLPAEALATYVLLGLGTILIKIVGGVPVLYDALVAFGGKRKSS